MNAARREPKLRMEAMSSLSRTPQDHSKPANTRVTKLLLTEAFSERVPALVVGRIRALLLRQSKAGVPL
jgi:hypothetical protein